MSAVTGMPGATWKFADTVAQADPLDRDARTIEWRGVAATVTAMLDIMQLLSSSVLLDICAGSLEFVQLWIQGRTASAGDFATSTIGAWIGLLIIVVVRRAHERKIIVSYK